MPGAVIFSGRSNPRRAANTGRCRGVPGRPSNHGATIGRHRSRPPWLRASGSRRGENVCVAGKGIGAWRDAGASAGLCLYPDRYSYRYGQQIGAGVPILDCAATGMGQPAGLPTVVWRAGLDLNPFDVNDPADLGCSRRDHDPQDAHPAHNLEDPEPDRGSGSFRCPETGHGAPPGTRTPNPRIKSPLLHSFILVEMLSFNAGTCRELSFCPVADIRDWLGIPDAAGVYRGIRAKMEQTWVRKGLVQGALPLMV